MAQWYVEQAASVVFSAIHYWEVPLAHLAYHMSFGASEL